MPYDLFIPAFITLLVIVDPVGTAAVFASLTPAYPKEEARRLAVKAMLVAFALYAFFGLFGMALLEHIGVSIAAFRIAGGLLLFVTGFRMIMGSHDEAQLKDGKAYQDRSNIVVFPLAIPLLAGPGCLTTFLLLLQHDPSWQNHVTIVIALVLVQALTLALLFSAKELAARLGPSVMSIIGRVMGILLASMAVQFIADGLKTLLS